MEVMVGTIMFAVLLALCVFTIVLSRENIFQKTYPFEVVFEDIMGLRDGDNVVVRGMTIGKVRSMVLKEDGVHVIAAIKYEHPVRLRTDYKVEVIATSVLGGRYLQIYEGSDHAPLLPKAARIRGEKPYDLISLLSGVADDLKDITRKVRGGEGTLGKLIHDDTLYDDARDAVGELKEIALKINNGEGTLGKLVNDDTLYVEAKKMIKDIRMGVDDIRETSPIVTFSSIFFGAF
jgi:phospholipid/cholesterol/gamma-HCH transport system substrate-binding protein